MTSRAFDKFAWRWRGGGGLAWLSLISGYVHRKSCTFFLCACFFWGGFMVMRHAPVRLRVRQSDLILGERTRQSYRRSNECVEANFASGVNNLRKNVVERKQRSVRLALGCLWYTLTFPFSCLRLFFSWDCTWRLQPRLHCSSSRLGSTLQHARPCRREAVHPPPDDPIGQRCLREQKQPGYRISRVTRRQGHHWRRLCPVHACGPHAHSH